MLRIWVGESKRRQSEICYFDPRKTLDFLFGFGYKLLMTHAKLVEAAIAWLRRYRCGIVLSEQGCASGEMPDAIGWKGKCHSVLAECKLSRADFLADAKNSGERIRRSPWAASAITRRRAACCGPRKCPRDGDCWKCMAREIDREQEVEEKPARDPVAS